MKGWLEKRGPLLGWSWDRRWCVLQPKPSESDYRWRLVYFADEACIEKKGEVDLVPNSRAVGFQERNALGHSVKHVGQRPFGFVLDSNPDAGKDRHLFYFDAGNAEVQKQWTAAINRVAEVCQPIYLQTVINWAELEQSKTQGEGSSDEDDWVEDLPDHVKVSAPTLARRRKAVSSEAYGEVNKLEEFQPVVVEKGPEVERRIREALLASPFLKVLGTRENDLRSAVAAFQRKHAVKGDVVIRQGDRVDSCLYILEQGNLDVFHMDRCMAGQAQGPPELAHGRKVGNLCNKEDEPWRCFGELALLFDGARASTLIAQEDCTLLTLDRPSFTQIMRFDVTHRRKRFFELLRSVKLLAPVDDLGVDMCVDAVSLQTFQKGDYVVRVGEKGSCVYMVEEGEAVAKIHGMDARSYKRGGYFGELSLINDRPRAADVVAASESLTVAILTREAFRRLLGQNALFGEQPDPAKVADAKSEGATTKTKTKTKKTARVGMAGGEGEKKEQPVVRGLRFAADPSEDAGKSTGFVRKGTGFIQADQLKKLLADADANGQDEVEIEAGVRFDEESEGAPSNNIQRKGTGFVQKEHLRKLLADAEEKGDQDCDDGICVRFDAPEGVGEHKQSIRRGTGFIQGDQLLKLIGEHGGEGGDGGGGGGLRFAEGTDADESKTPLARKGTGFVQVEHVKKLLAEAEENSDDEVELDADTVRFDEEALAGGGEPKQSIRRGTGYVAAEQMRKLLAEAEANGEDEIELPRVQFNVEEGVGEPKQSIRRGTGFVQAEMMEKLIAQAEAQEKELLEAAGNPAKAGGFKLARTVSFSEDTKMDEPGPRQGSTRSSAGEIFIDKRVLEGFEGSQ